MRTRSRPTRMAHHPDAAPRNWRSSIGIAIPMRRPNGASTAIVTATRTENGDETMCSTSDGKKNVDAAISTVAAVSAKVQAPSFVAPLGAEPRAHAREREQRGEHDRQRVRRVAEHQHEALDEHRLDQQVAETDEHEVRERARWRPLDVTSEQEWHDVAEHRSAVITPNVRNRMSTGSTVYE